MKKSSATGLVYSTDFGGVCKKCGRQLKKCACGGEAVRPPADGVVRVGRQTKGRKGSGVTLISGLPLAEPELKELASRLKQRCGSGGAVKNGVVEIQGDHRELLVNFLAGLGYKVKLAGG